MAKQSKKEHKEITLMLVIQYILMIFLTLFSINLLFEKIFLSGILFFICALLIDPTLNNFLIKHFKIKLSIPLRVGAILFLILIAYNSDVANFLRNLST